MILGPNTAGVSSSKTCGCVVDVKDNRGIHRAVVQSHDCDASKYVACEVPRKFFMRYSFMGDHVCLFVVEFYAHLAGVSLRYLGDQTCVLFPKRAW